MPVPPFAALQDRQSVLLAQLTKQQSENRRLKSHADLMVKLRAKATPKPKKETH